jgi:hypothetical protein
MERKFDFLKMMVKKGRSETKAKWFVEIKGIYEEDERIIEKYKSAKGYVNPFM